MLFGLTQFLLAAVEVEQAVLLAEAEAEAELLKVGSIAKLLHHAQLVAVEVRLCLAALHTFLI
jgi:hypothetical protein